MPIHPLLPTPVDGLDTETSLSQAETESETRELLLPFSSSLPPAHVDTPRLSVESLILQRRAHLDYLRPMLLKLPSQLVVLDASRSWLLFWILGSFSLMGVELNLDERRRGIETILSFQSPSGGFGGGPGFMPHLAATYACVCSLAILTSDAPASLAQDTWARVDRRSMHDFFLSLKQPDGSFRIQSEGEIDLRATYAVVTVASLLNFLTPELLDSVPESIQVTQTYEGGMAAGSARPADVAAFPLWTGFPLGEAHGAYASCGLASYFMVQELCPSPPEKNQLDVQACLRWAAHIQTLPVEGGGFRGRTNKLVDGCYSWWSGSLFPVLDALLSPASSQCSKRSLPDLFDRRALQEYVLIICQDTELPNQVRKGGLRDKPGLNPDVYHTFYVLSGLSLSQHRHVYNAPASPPKTTTLHSRFQEDLILGQNELLEGALARMERVYSKAQGWGVLDDQKIIVGVPDNELFSVHPIYNLRHTVVKDTMSHFYPQAS